MSFKLSNTYLKLFIMTAAASAMLVGSECLHRLYFDIVPLGRPWEEFLYLLTFTSILCFSRWAFTKVCAAFFLFLCLIVNPVHFEVYQSWINGINYYLALAEWSEVANTGVSMIPKLIPTILWGLVDLLIVVLLYKYSQKIRQGKSRWPILDVLFVLLIAIVSIRSFDTRQEHGISPKTSYGKVKSNYFSFGYFLGRVLPYKVFNLSKITDYRSLAPTRLSDPKIDHIIFIVGESESAAHVGAFGYERNTTPFFSEIKGRDDFIVRPIHSAAFMTAVALPTLFNAIPQPNGMVQIMHGTTNLFRLAKDQGFQTYWFTAQARNEMNILNLIGGKWIDKITFPEAFGLSDRESMPDFNLLTQFDTVNFNTGRQFVILHQRGFHTPYGTLLSTEEVSVYGDSIVDHYDATILKTDKLIQTVYESIQKKGLKNWLLLYTSDHGAYVTNKTYNQGTVRCLPSTGFNIRHPTPRLRRQNLRSSNRNGQWQHPDGGCWMVALQRRYLPIHLPIKQLKDREGLIQAPPLQLHQFNDRIKPSTLSSTSGANGSTSKASCMLRIQVICLLANCRVAATPAR